MPLPYETFKRAHSVAQIALARLATDAERGMREEVPDDMRHLAKQAEAIGEAIRTMFSAGAEMCGADAKFEADNFYDFADELRVAAQKLDEDEAERQAERRWERQHRQSFEAQRD